MFSPSIRLRAMVCGSAVAALAACTSLTSIRESWKAPDAGPVHFEKVLVLARVQDQSARRVAEDTLQAKLVGTSAVQSYKVLTTEDLGDKERTKARLRDGGFDGAVIVRLVSADQRITTYAGTSGGFWGSSWYYSYPYTDVQVDTVVQVEINLYSLTEDKLLWAGRSETIDPRSIEQLISEIVDAAGEEMRKQGLIASPSPASGG